MLLSTTHFDFEKSFLKWKVILYRLLYDLLYRLVVLTSFNVLDHSLSISDCVPPDEVCVDLSELFILVFYYHLCVRWLISQTKEFGVLFSIVFGRLRRLVLKLNLQIFLVEYDNSFLEIVESLIVAFAENLSVRIQHADFRDD